MKNLQSTYLSQLLLAPTILALCLLFIMIAACDSSTSPETGTLIGMVMLVNDTGNPDLDSVDFSGVSIKLYHPVELDTTLTRINMEYPHIGVIIGQETEFDHRRSIPVYETQTDPEGSFSQDGIARGYYNVVVSKENWGIRYYHNVQIDSGTLDLNNLHFKSQGAISTKNNIILNPEVVLSGFIQGNFEFESYKAYLIEDDLTINGNVTLSEGARIEITNMKNIVINGSLNTEISSEGIYSLVTSAHNSLDSTTQFGGIVVNGNIALENCIVEYSLNGIKMNGAASTISNCIIRNGSGGMTFENNILVDISKSQASGIQDVIPSIYTSFGGFYTLGCEEVSIDKVILQNNTVGVKIKDYCEAQVSNSYFVLNNYGAESYASLSMIENNVFERSKKYDIRVCGDELDPVIQRNYFLSDKGICIGLDINFNYYDCTPAIYSNNFNNTIVFMHMVGYNRIDIDATMNYFFIVDESLISTMIIDREDYVYHGHPNMVIENTAYINFTPYCQLPIPGVGIE